MVKFRGVEVCLISQFDISRLPEFPISHQTLLSDPFRVDAAEHIPNLACCYVPIYPGCQFWFEYSVEGPHPPGAVYFFKLFINHKHVVSWDCTAKTGFHGKMMYSLSNEGRDLSTGEELFRRHAIRFSDVIEKPPQSGEPVDFMEIKMYRVERRKKIANIAPTPGIAASRSGNIQFFNGGIIEPSLRARRYKYQLLDPLDMPFTAFRFYCRSYEYLERRGIASLNGSSSICSLVSSPNWQFHSPSSPRQRETPRAEGRQNGCIKARITPEPATNPRNRSPHTAAGFSYGSPSREPPSSSGRDMRPAGSFERATTIPLSDSRDSLSIRTKDSIEDLQSTVPRSPKSPKSSPSSKKAVKPVPCECDHDAPPTPTKSPKSRRQRLQKRLVVNLGGAEFDLEKKRRPSSPFDSMGFLRNATVPPSAPPSVTEFGPTVDDEVRANLRSVHLEGSASSKPCLNTTSTARGGKSLMSYLERRISKERGTSA